MSNFRELVEELATEYCGASAPNSVTNQKGESKRFVDWINRANKDLQNLWANWKFLWVNSTFSTVTDQRAYTPFTDIGEWNATQFYIGDDPLAVTYHETSGRFDQTETGKPHTVVIMPDNSLQLYPLPDAAYSINCEYYRAPQELKENTDISLIPEKFHDVIVLRAVVKYAHYESAPELLELARVEYPERLTQLEASQLPGQNSMHNFSMNDFRVETE